MDPDSHLLGIRGHLIDSPRFGKLRERKDAAILVENGRIADVGDYNVLHKRTASRKVRWLHTPRVAVFPGLIDLHSHLPQYPAVAKGQSDLLPWLRQYIFPLEREFAAPKAKKESTAFFRELARNGTTTAMLYASIHEGSCEAAFQAAEKSGLRIIMGKLMMDIGSYGQLQPKKILSVSLLESEQLCEKWHGAGNGLLEYAFSPRFAVSCSEKLMKGAAELAVRHSAYLQTHLAENFEEIEKVRHQFTWASDYTDVYEKCGLLTPKTVLGHCIHLSDREMDVLAESGAKVAHCPTANLFLSSGIMPLEKLHDRDVSIGLGTDVGAGTELNLWQVMRSAIESQKARSFYDGDARVPSPAEVFHMATQGAAEVLGKGNAIGSLEPGREADFTVVDYGALTPYYRKSGRQSKDDLGAEDILSLCIYRGGPHATLETFVRGNSVYRADEPDLF